MDANTEKTTDLQTELEVLQAIYQDNILVLPADASSTPTIIWHPNSEDEGLEVELKLTDEYPFRVPEVSFVGVSNDQLACLKEVVASNAENWIGSPMLFNIMSAISDWIQSNGSEKITVDSIHSGEDKVENQGDPSSAGNGKKKKAEGSSPMPKKSMRTAIDVVNRIRWDEALDADDFIVAHLDRFDGVLEGPFSSYDWDEPLFPQHRIQYFKFKDEIVWDKRGPIFDHVFGSRGEGLRIEDIIARHENADDTDRASRDGESSTSDNDEDEMSCSEDGEGTGSHRYKYKNANRPNHFVCIKITNPKIVSKIAQVQEVLAPDKVMSDGVLPPAMLHVSLCMLRISSDEGMEKAKRVLNSALFELVTILSSCDHFVLEGLDTFRDRLIYAKVKEHTGLAWFSAHLIKRFQDAGLSTPGNHKEFVPHVTIFKLTRPMSKTLGIRFLDRAMTIPYQNTFWGSQEVESILLCPGGNRSRDNLDPDGFYHRFHVVNTGFVPIHPSLPDIVADRVSELREQGFISDDLAQEVDAQIQSHTAKLDATLKSLDSSVPMALDSSKGSAVLVLIVRGLPGSGKSQLLAELQTHFKAVICSADSYFEQNSLDYDQSGLAAAHFHCFSQFVAAVERQPEIIAIDSTNSRLWEYQLYVKIARMMGFGVKVVEITCTGAAAMKAFALRNEHNVPYPTITKMFERWEADPAAHLVPPVLEYGFMSEDPSQEVVKWCMESLQRKQHRPEVVYSALLLHQKSRVDLVRCHVPTLANVLADHVTIAFNPSEAHAMSLPLGKTVKVKVVGIADDKSVQVAAVKPMTKYSIEFQSMPHISISVANGVPPRASRNLLARDNGAQLKPCNPMELEGVVACLVNSRGDFGRLERIVDKDRLREVLHDSHPCEQDEKQHTLIARRQGVKDLYVFDFDGTLFNTPDAFEGKAFYEKATGKYWPFKGFYSRAQSLLPPLHVYPGPALGQYHTHCDHPGAITVILTGRRKDSSTGVEHVLKLYGINAHRLILKGDSAAVSDYKIQAIEGLLKEFPTVTRVKIWDDLCENISGFYELKKTHSDIDWEIVDALSLPEPPFGQPHVATMGSAENKAAFLDGYLCAQGWLPDGGWGEAARAGMQRIAECWGRAIGMNACRRLALVFGSFPLGRKSDMDVCLLAPQSLTHLSCMIALESELKNAGISHVYSGHSARCPRLKVRIEFRQALPQEYDIVFCRVHDKALRNGVSTLQELEACMIPGDEVSKVALGGPKFLDSLQEIVRNQAQCRQVAVVVETLSRILQVHGLKGNAFHCPRTFHLTRIVAGCSINDIESSEELLVRVLKHCCSLADKDWMKLFGQFVPERYIKPMKTIFHRSLGIAENPAFPSWETLQSLFHSSWDYPPAGYSQLVVKCTSEGQVLRWSIMQLLEAKTGKCIRTIIDAGYDVSPGSLRLNGDAVEIDFAVDRLEKASQVVREAVVALQSDIEAFSHSVFCTVEGDPS